MCNAFEISTIRQSSLNLRISPWLVDLREANVITVYTGRERVLPETDPFGRQILIGRGAFLELLVIALASQGLTAQVALWPQRELPASLKAWDRRPVARITLTPKAADAAPDELFTHILNRHTPKTDFDPARAVSPAALQSLRYLCWQSAKVELLTPLP